MTRHSIGDVRIYTEEQVELGRLFAFLQGVACGAGLTLAIIYLGNWFMRWAAWDITR